MSKESFLIYLFDSFNSLKISYFVIGEYSELPKDLGESDLDLVVSEIDMPKVFHIFSNAICLDKSITLVSYYENEDSKFLRFLTPEWGVQIDIYYKDLLYRGAVYYPISRMKEDIVEYNGIKVLNRTKGFYINYIKEILHNGNAKTKYIDAFLDLVNSNKEFYFSELQQLYGSCFSKLITNNLTKDEITSTQRQQQKLLKSAVLKGQKISILYSRLSQLPRLLKKRPGYVIAVEGTDGSGKSFIINSITPLLNEAFHNGIVYNHLRPNLIPDIAELLGKRKHKDHVQGTVVSDPHEGKVSGLIVSLFRWSYYMIDYTFGYMKKVWFPIHTKSKVFIFDRYYYEYYLDPIRSHTNLPYWIIRIGELLIPKPDLILCLGGDPEKIYSRKPETSLEEVKRQTIALHDFYAMRKNAVWIDTTTDPQKSINVAMNAILNVMSNRFSI